MGQDWRKWSLLGCSLAGIAWSGTSAAEEATSPNILLICVDDLNDWIEPLAGHPDVRTPNINRLAERGVVFRNAYCQIPLSGPSRTSLLSGMYPSTTGVYYQIKDKNLRKVPALAECDFMPEYFARHGYKTMAAGKVFHGGGGDNAFQEFGGTFGMYGPRPEKRFKYDPTWYGKPSGTQTDWGVYPEEEEDMPDYKTVEWISAKLAEKHDKPFFMAAGLVRPHVPWYLPSEWFEKLSADGVTLPPFNPDDYDDIPEIAKQVTTLPQMPDFDWVVKNGYWKEIVHAYLSCVMFMDHQVGKLLDALDKSPYKDNTIIVFYGDNGYELGEKQRFAKHALWRTPSHVPMIICAPGFARGKVSEANVGLIDIYPTLVSLCQLPANLANEGTSLVPLLEKPGKKWELPVCTFYGPDNQSVVWRNYHYIRYSDGAEELYDLKSDPKEWTNHASNPAYAKVLSQLRDRMIQGRADNVPLSKNTTNEYFKKLEEQQ